MGKLRDCSRCGTRCEEECPTCCEWYEQRPDPATEMTPEERVQEVRSWKICEISFGKIQKRIEELVGRSVWTHEMVDFEGLAEEARKRTGDASKMIDRLPKDKPVAVVVTDDDD